MVLPATVSRRRKLDVIGGCDNQDMQGSTSLSFAQAARSIGTAARGLGLVVPTFRAPPRISGVDRTIRRYPGGAVVSVRLRGRLFGEIATDMIEGIIVANGLVGEQARGARIKLRTGIQVKPTTGAPPRVVVPAGGPPSAAVPPAVALTAKTRKSKVEEVTAQAPVTSRKARVAERQTQAA